MTEMESDFCGHCNTPRDRSSEIRSLAHALMAKHGITEKGWRFKFNRHKTTVGYCEYTPREISISQHWAELLPMSTIENTILHEIAHALCGPRTGHSALWVETARSIGSTGTRCADTSGYKLVAPWTAVCPNGHSATAHRSPQRVKACGQCSRRFNPEYIFEWKKEGKAVEMSKNYNIELFRLKKKYTNLKVA